VGGGNLLESGGGVEGIPPILEGLLTRMKILFLPVAKKCTKVEGKREKKQQNNILIAAKTIFGYNRPSTFSHRHHRHPADTIDISTPSRIDFFGLLIGLPPKHGRKRPEGRRSDPPPSPF